MFSNAESCDFNVVGYSCYVLVKNLDFSPMQIVWDKEKNRWVNTDEDPNDADKNAGPAAPPKDSEVTPKLSTPLMPTPSPSDLPGNKFTRQKIRGSYNLLSFCVIGAFVVLMLLLDLH